MKTIVQIPGMHCHACATLVTQISYEFPSVKKVEVDLETKKVTLEHDDAFDVAWWTKEIEALGDEYKVLNQ